MYYKSSTFLGLNAPSLPVLTEWWQPNPPLEEEEDIYIGQGYRYALRDQDAFCLVIQDSLQGKSELQG